MTGASVTRCLNGMVFDDAWCFVKLLVTLKIFEDFQCPIFMPHTQMVSVAAFAFSRAPSLSRKAMIRCHGFKMPTGYSPLALINVATFWIDPIDLIVFMI